RSSSAILPKCVSKKGVHWIEPRLVAEIQYSRVTADAILRHASFQGLREDKNPEEVVYDPVKLGKAAPAASLTPTLLSPTPASGGGKAAAKAEGGSPKAKPRTSKAQASKPAATKPPISQARRDGSIDFAGVR